MACTFVQELRDELGKLGMDTKGLKADLQKRLEDAVSSVPNGTANVQAKDDVNVKDVKDEVKLNRSPS